MAQVHMKVDGKEFLTGSMGVVQTLDDPFAFTDYSIAYQDFGPIRRD